MQFVLQENQVGPIGSFERTAVVFVFSYNDPKQRTGLRPTVQNRYIFSDKVMHEVFNGGWESFENGGALRS